MVEDFQEIVWQKGRELYREMPWRDDTRPYFILVSELMLQQTQVERVIPKFHAFIAAFANEAALASASLSDVVTLWQGLGYNRRAKYLHDAAKMIVQDFGGVFPKEYAELIALPGVGPNTAGAIMAYAYNQPIVFVETNVRTVYFEHFFSEAESVSDAELRRCIATTLDQVHPREFYWAVMDYGSWLKKQGAGRLGISKHYKKQPPLKGSVREIRGQIVHILSAGDLSISELQAAVTYDERFDLALAGLQRDGLVSRTQTVLHLAR